MGRKGTKAFGKGVEHLIMAKLMKEGFDVYLTLIDDIGIDCIIRLSKTRYLDIQIKASSKDATQPYNFGGIAVKNIRDNYFFIFYVEPADKFWVIPSLDFPKLFGKTTKEGIHKGKFNVNMPRLKGKKYKQFKKYEGKNGLSLLN